jgi:hypothetical protein
MVLTMGMLNQSIHSKAIVSHWTNSGVTLSSGSSPGCRSHERTKHEIPRVR